MQKAKKTEVKEIVVSKESVYDNLLVCASSDEADQIVTKSIEDWDVSSAIDISAPSSSSFPAAAATTVIANAAQSDGSEAETPCGVSTRNMIGTLPFSLSNSRALSHHDVCVRLD
jgi:hypothetical protein